METTLNIVSIIIIVFGILQIILFFKIRSMTDNVSSIKNMIELYLKRESQQNDKHAPIPNKTSVVSNVVTNKRRWSSDATEDDKEKAQSIIPHLNTGEIIIKIIKNDKIIVYNENDLYELANEEYKIIYY